MPSTIQCMRYVTGLCLVSRSCQILPAATQTRVWGQQYRPDVYVVVQTDGWLSEGSAAVYENSTETLFLGKQDAMQRQTLVPLSAFMAPRGPRGRGTRLLELACGTGRFATFIKVPHDHMPVLLNCGSLSGVHLLVQWC